MKIADNLTFVSDLIQILDRHLALFSELRKIALKQNQFLREGDIQSFLLAKSRQQNLFRTLREHRAEIERYHACWTRSKLRIPHADKARIFHLIRQIEEVIKGLLEVERQNKELVNSAQGDVRETIRRLQNNARAIKKYLFARKTGLPLLSEFAFLDLDPFQSFKKR